MKLFLLILVILFFPRKCSQVISPLKFSSEVYWINSCDKIWINIASPICPSTADTFTAAIPISASKYKVRISLPMLDSTRYILRKEEMTKCKILC